MFFLFAAFFVASFASNYGQAKFGREMKNFFAVAFYSVVTCAISSVFFLVMSGFSLQFNKTVWNFSVFYSAVVLASQYLGIIVYKYMEILSFGLIRNGMTLVFTFLAGAVMYNEKITFVAIMRMLLSVMAALLLVLSSKSKNNDVKIKNTPLGYMICFALIIFGVFSTVILKEFANLPQKQDENSSFFLVNIICFVFSSMATVILQKGKLRHIINDLKTMGKNGYLYILVSTIGSNLVSVLSIWLLAGETAVILYAPLIAAMGVIIQAVVSYIVAKEKIPMIPVLLSLLSAILSFVN